MRILTPFEGHTSRSSSTSGESPPRIDLLSKKNGNSSSSELGTDKRKKEKPNSRNNESRWSTIIIITLVRSLLLKPEVYRARRGERNERGPSRFVEWVRVTGSCWLEHGPAAIRFPPFRALRKEEESRLLRVWPFSFFFVDRLRYYLPTKNEEPRAGSKLSKLCRAWKVVTRGVGREWKESSRRSWRFTGRMIVTRVVTGLLEGDCPFNFWWTTMVVRIGVIYRTWIYLYLLVRFIYMYVFRVRCDRFIDT